MLNTCMKLAPKQVKETREQLVAQQGYKCAICHAPILEGSIVHLDHDHKSGAIRGALHGVCNMLLGKVENGLRRGVPDPDGFVRGLAEYLEFHKTNQTGLLHPTHFTADEKKERQKKRAQKIRARKKRNAA